MTEQGSRNRALRLSLNLGGLAVFTILVSFLLQWFTVTRLGAGDQTDALFAAIVAPQVVYDVLGGSLVYALVPLLSVLDDRGAHREAWNVLLLTVMVSAGVALLLWVTAPFLVRVLVPGFSAGTQTLTVRLLVIVSFGMIFESCNAVLRSFYHSRLRFQFPEVTSAVAVLAATVWLLWGLPRFGVGAAAWSYVMRSGLDFVLLVPALAQIRLPDWGSSVVRETGRRLRPIILGSAYYRSDLLVDRFLSSMAPPGHLSLLSLARQVHHASARVLNRALAAPVVPQLAESAHVGNWSSFERIYKKRLRWTLLTISAGFGIFAIFGRQLLELVFRGRNFTPENVQLLWWLMILLGGVLIADPLIQVSWNAFYAMGHASTPNRIGSVAYTLGIVFRFIGFYLAGIKGIALGTSCYYCLNLLLLQLALERTQRASRALMRADPVI